MDSTVTSGYPYDDTNFEPLAMMKPSQNLLKHSDPVKTIHCNSPYSTKSPLVQYALMIDGGSTGSRVHIYKSTTAVDHEYEVSEMTQPGLSSFTGKPQDAAKSLDVLLDEAVRVLPKSLQSYIPIAVKATAELRLRPGSQGAAII